jgi:hypothetical protein
LYVKRRETYNIDRCALYSVLWGQCSEAMQVKIKSADSYNTMDHNSNSLELIKVIKGAAYKFESQQNIYLTLDNAKCTFYAYQHQVADETNAAYMSKFKNTIEVIERFGGSVGDDKALMLDKLKSAGQNDKTATDKEKATAAETAKRKAHAIAFLK